MTSKQNFFSQMKELKVEPKKVSARFPFQDHDSVEAFEAVKDDKILYACFSSEGKLIAHRVEVMK